MGTRGRQAATVLLKQREAKKPASLSLPKILSLSGKEPSPARRLPRPRRAGEAYGEKVSLRKALASGVAV